MKDQYDKRQKFRSFEEGDKVLMIRPKRGNQFQKFQPKFEGPYTIVKLFENGNAYIVPYKITGKRKLVHQNNLSLLPFLIAFPEFRTTISRRGVKESDSSQNKSPEPVFVDDTPLPIAKDSYRPLPTFLPRAESQSRSQSQNQSPNVHTDRSSQQQEESSFTSESSTYESLDTVSPIPSPQWNVGRNTRSRTGPLPREILHTYPEERKQSLTTKMKEFFSPTKRK